MISLDTHLSLLHLNQTYWACVDGLTEKPGQHLFTTGGRLQLGSLDLNGQEQIEIFFKNRALEHQASGRVTRHFSSGFTPEMVGSERILVRSVVIVFAGSGTLPLPSDAPATIADVDDVLVLSSTGEWLFDSRVVKPVFVGSSAAKFAQRT